MGHGERPIDESTRDRIGLGLILSAGAAFDRLPPRHVALQLLVEVLVGVKQVNERLWLVTFMHYDLGYFDDETCRLEPIDNPSDPKLLPMSPE